MLSSKSLTFTCSYYPVNENLLCVYMACVLCFVNVWSIQAFQPNRYFLVWWKLDVNMRWMYSFISWGCVVVNADKSLLYCTLLWLCGVVHGLDQLPGMLFNLDTEFCLLPLFLKKCYAVILYRSNMSMTEWKICLLRFRMVRWVLFWNSWKWIWHDLFGTS